MSSELSACGLATPTFRSPPRIVGTSRTLRKRSDGSVVAAVALKGRPWSAIVSDVIECVVRVNELGVVEAARLRDQLWESIDAQASKAA